MAKPNIDSIELRDFLELLQGFKAFIQNSAAYLWDKTRKHGIILFIPLLLSIAYGFWKYSSTESVYSVEMQLGYNQLHKKTYGEMVLALQDQIKQGNWEYVAEELGLSVSEAESIVEIWAQNIKRSPLNDDLSADKSPFYVVANLKDPSISTKLQAGIIRYFIHNPLNQERARINKKNLADRLTFLEDQLAWMDSIKVSYNAQLKNGIQAERAAGELSIDKLFALSDTFYKEWLEVRSGLDSYKPVELILGFNPGKSAQKPAMTKFLIRYAFIGFVLSFLLLFWLAIPSVKRSNK